MKIESKNVLKVFLPLLLDIVKGVLKYFRNHKGNDKEPDIGSTA